MNIPEGVRGLFMVKSQGSLEVRPPPYVPGWVNRLVVWVDQLPLPSWMFYLTIGVALILAQAAIKWEDGGLPRGNFYLPLILFSGAGVYTLALMHSLIRKVPQALARMRSAIKESEVDFDLLVYRMVNAPARPILLSTLAGLGFGYFLQRQIMLAATPVFKMSTSPISAVFDGSLLVLTWGVLGAGVYSLMYLLETINITYLRYTQINLFEPQPLYSLSGLASRASLGIALYNLPWITLTPGASSIPLIVGITLVFQVLAAAVFVVPLLGVHQLLIDDKSRRVQIASKKLEIILEEVHRKIDIGNTDGIDGQQKSLALIQTELTTIEKAPTWPWHPETMRVVISAVFLPMLIWLAQRLLGRLSGLGN